MLSEKTYFQGIIPVLALSMAISLFLPCAAFSFQEVKVILTHSPPWRTAQAKSFEGPEIEIIQQISRRMGVRPVFKSVSFKSCLREIETGDGDITSGLFKSRERQKYILFMEPPYKKRSDKVFYLLKDYESDIKKYSDLYSMHIGVQEGVRYFPRFDNDNTFRKVRRNNAFQLFEILFDKQVDTLIITPELGDDILKQLGALEGARRAEFSYQERNPVYFGLSKNSLWAGRWPEVRKLYKDMAESGEIDRIIHSYFEKRGLPVPDYR